MTSETPKDDRPTAPPQGGARTGADEWNESALLIDDPTRLAEEARAIVEKNAAEIRKESVPIATEPSTVYRP